MVPATHQIGAAPVGARTGGKAGHSLLFLALPIGDTVDQKPLGQYLAQADDQSFQLLIASNAGIQFVEDAANLSVRLSMDAAYFFQLTHHRSLCLASSLIALSTELLFATSQASPRQR